MRCFYHQDREAVGACKSCGKGLCPECAVDLGKGLACRGRCEADVQAVIKLVDQNVRQMGEVQSIMNRNRSVLKQARSTRFATGVLYSVVGVIFTGLGASDMERFTFAFALGVALLVYGVFLLARPCQKDKPPEEKPES
jgi:hypothetical protein